MHKIEFTTENIENSLSSEFLRYMKRDMRYSENTIRNYLYDCNEFLEYLKGINLLDFTDVNSFVIYQYSEGLYDKSLQEASLKRKISSIESLFRWLIVHHEFENNPVSAYRARYKQAGVGGRKGKRLPVYLSQNEIDSIFDTLFESVRKDAERNSAIIGFLLDTGLRADEFENVTIYDGIQMMETNRIRVVGKGNKEREVKVMDTYRSYLQRHLKQIDLSDKGALLFQTRTGGAYRQPNLHQLVSGLLKKCGIVKKQHGPHLLRHTAATLLLKQTGNVKVVQNFLGHESLQTTGIYASLVD